jgi:phosphate uptake regulator
MIIRTDSGPVIDTADLSPEERHVIQKLLAWMTLVDTIDQFYQKKQQALAAGWNDSGPIRESRSLSLVIRHLEKQVRQRLKNQSTR